MEAPFPGPQSPRIVLRIGAALAIALALALGSYLLFEAMRPDYGLVGISFLIVLPAAINALVCYIADPLGRRQLTTYLTMPLLILVLAIIAAVLLLKEGVVCILLFSPIWLVSGLTGAILTFIIRKRLRDGRKYCTVLLLAPWLAMQVEPAIPLPEADVTVARTVIVAAPAERIWPLVEGIHDVGPHEGTWNIAQDVIGIPRPQGAWLIGEGIGADRFAAWDNDVRFRERITRWQRDRLIGWRFIFDHVDRWKYADRHLLPDSPYLRVTDGSYRLEPIDGQHTRVTLDTRYWMRTPVNAYAALWGEVILGGLETNLLALIRQRAER